MRFRFVWLAALLLAVPTITLAQSFDVPAFQTPFAESGFGLFAFSPQSDRIGAMAIWRQSGDRVDLGLRGGFLEFDTGEAYFAGVEVKSGRGHRDDTGTEAALVSGLGIGWAPDQDFARVRLPLGVSIGKRHTAGSLAFVPYVVPRLLLDVNLAEVEDPDGGGRWDEDTDVHFDLDLGFDVEFSRLVTARFGATLGHDEVIGVGLSVVGF